MVAKGTAAAAESSGVGSEAASEARRRHWSWWFVVGVFVLLCVNPQFSYPKIEGTYTLRVRTLNFGV